MGNEGHSGSESMPSLGDAAPQTLGAGQSVRRYARVGTQPSQHQLKRKPGEIDEADPRGNKKRIDKAYRERVKQEQLKIKDERDQLADDCKQLKTDLESLRGEKKNWKLLAENERLTLKNEHSEQIRSLEKQHSDKVEGLQKQHLEEIRSLQAEIRSLQAELRDAIVKKERSDFEIESLKRALDEEKKQVFNNWGTELSLRQRILTGRFKRCQIFSSSPLQSGETLRTPDSCSTKFSCEKVLKSCDVSKMVVIPTHFITDLPTMSRSYLWPRRYSDGRYNWMDSAESLWKFVFYIHVHCSERSVFQSGRQVVLYKVLRCYYGSEAPVTRLISIIGLGVLTISVNGPRPSYDDAN